MKRFLSTKFFISLLLMFLIIIGYNRCNQQPSKEQQPGPAPASSAVPLTGKLHKLILLKKDYEYLRDQNGTGQKAKKLFLNFYFDDLLLGYPTLVAYASKNKEYLRERDSVMLAPTGSGHLTLPVRKFLGNQEIQIDGNPQKPGIEDLLKSVFGTNPQNYDHILFTPEIDPVTNYVYYKLSVVCLPTPCPNPMTETTTNPSPPKNGE